MHSSRRDGGKTAESSCREDGALALAWSCLPRSLLLLAYASPLPGGGGGGGRRRRRKPNQSGVGDLLRGCKSEWSGTASRRGKKKRGEPIYRHMGE